MNSNTARILETLKSGAHPTGHRLEVFLTHEDGEEFVNIIHMYDLARIDFDEGKRLEELLEVITRAIAADARRRRQAASLDSAAS